MTQCPGIWPGMSLGHCWTGLVWAAGLGKLAGRVFLLHGGFLVTPGPLMQRPSWDPGLLVAGFLPTPPSLSPKLTYPSPSNFTVFYCLNDLLLYESWWCIENDLDAVAASKTLPGRLSQNRKAHRPHKMLKSHGLFNQFKTCSEKQGEIDGVMNALRIQCLQGGKTVIPGFWTLGYVLTACPLHQPCLSMVCLQGLELRLNKVFSRWKVPVTSTSLLYWKDVQPVAMGPQSTCWLVVLGRIMAPKDAHVLVPRTVNM